MPIDILKLEEPDDTEAPGDTISMQMQHDWRLQLEEFAQQSSIHGLKHLTSTHQQCCKRSIRRPLSERIFWLVSMLISVVCFIIFLVHLFNRWERGPLFAGLAEKSQPIWDIPFPAVTICPETKAKTSHINFTDAYHILMEANGPPYNLTDETLQRVEALALLCDAHLTENLKLGQSTANEGLLQQLREMAPTFEEAMFYCKLHKDTQPCTRLFSEIWTDDGLCFTFNMLNSKELYHDGVQFSVPTMEHNESTKDWSTETGYNKNQNPGLNVTVFPYRAHSPGNSGGLFVLLRLYNYDFDYLCRGPVMGFKVLLHSPDEMPQMVNHYFKVPLNQETIVKVKPNVVTSCDQVRGYSPKRRQCYFNGEKTLRYFKVYTQRNCELECFSAYLLKKCNCTHFSYPRDKNVPTCGSASITCSVNAERELLEQNRIDGLTNDQTDCNCLPSCSSVTYEADVQHAFFEWKKLFEAFKSPLNEFAGMEAARLSIMFKDSHFTATKRYELYNHTELLALFGGLLALFFGASILSILEILYYLVLKQIYNHTFLMKLKLRS